jgi:hypothetical protein
MDDTIRRVGVQPVDALTTDAGPSVVWTTCRDSTRESSAPGVVEHGEMRVDAELLL